MRGLLVAALLPIYTAPVNILSTKILKIPVGFQYFVEFGVAVTTSEFYFPFVAAVAVVVVAVAVAVVVVVVAVAVVFAVAIVVYAAGDGDTAHAP